MTIKLPEVDPLQTWRDLCDALAEDDRQIALEHAGNLLQWIRRGGYNPINCSHGGSQALLRTIIAGLREKRHDDKAS
jgi:hypothetical protein